MMTQERHGLLKSAPHLTDRLRAAQAIPVSARLNGLEDITVTLVAFLTQTLPVVAELRPRQVSHRGS